MSRIESRIGKVNYQDEKIYSFISEFSNFTKLIPYERVESWEADADTCSFSIAGIGKAGLRIIEREPHKLIKIKADEKTPIGLTMWVQLKKIAENDTRVKITLDPAVNPIMMSMFKKHLQNFVDELINQIEKYQF